MLTLLSLLFAPPVLAADPPVDQAAPLTAGPELLELAPATYPAEAAAEKREAEVTLLLSLDETGTVVGAEVVTSAGPDFDAAAIAAVNASRFAPAQTADGPVGVQVEFTYAFTLASLAVDAVENLGGVVRQKGTRVPLAGVEVQVTVGDARFRAVTDEAGAWSLAGLPAGPATVRAVFPGHDPATTKVEVRTDDTAEVALWLRSESYADTVAVGLYSREEEVVVTRRRVSMDEARAVPGTLGDPIRVVQNLPGVARPGFLSGALIIRGANPEDSRVFIDGVEVPIVYHLGGLRSVVPAGMVGSVDYLPGSYPVRYGRGGGGVVDIHTTSVADSVEPGEWMLNWRTDFLDTGVFAQGRVGDLGLSLGARRSYVDGILSLMPDTGPSISPSWLDYQLKLEGLGDGPADWSLFVFGLEDSVEFIVSDDLEQESRGPSGGLSDAFGSHRVVGRWARPLADGWDVDIQPSFGWDRSQTDVGTDIEFSEDNLRFGLRSRLTWTPGDHLQLIGGLDAQAFRFDSTSFMSADFASGGMGDGGGRGGEGGPGGLGENPFSPESSTTETEDQSTDGDGWVYAPDIYIEGRWRPLSDPDRLVIQPGLRLVTLGLSDAPFQTALDPRIAARWQAWPGGTLKGGTGLHHQAPEDEVLAFNNGEATGFSRTWSSEVGVEQDLFDQGSIDLTVFNRQTDGRFVLNDELVNLATDPMYVSEGLGRANGMEVLLRKDPTGPLSGWVSYTLSRSERLDHPDDPDADWVRFDYDQTHILTATAQYRLPHDFVVSGRYQYVTGNPTTAYDGAVADLDSGQWTGVLSDDENGARLGAYSSLDLRASKLWTFQNWQLDTYADLLGVVQGDNPEAELQAYDYSESVTISGLPFIPSVGFEARVRF